MGKKKGGTRKMRQDDDDDFDDAVSYGSAETGWTNATEDGDYYDTKEDGDEEAIDEALEELLEKRLATRVAALEKLTKHLLQYLPADLISESFVSSVIGCLRKPSEDEAVFGSRILSIIALIFGEDEERFYQRSKSVLEPLAKTARNAKAKAASIRSLALICFVCSGEDENVDEVMALFRKYFDVKIVGTICTSALESWGLLASSLSDDVLSSDEYFESYMPQFMALLDHADVEVRSAAGENIALLYESAQKCGMTLDYDEEVVERLRVMSKDSSKKTSKKDRKVQRSVFRDVYATLSSGESPQISFSIKNEVLSVRSWKSVKQFEAIKGCLRSGLQEHIKYNNIIRRLLDLPETIEDHAIDRRDIFDKKSVARKQRSNEIKGDRRRKQNMQDAFLDDY